MESIGLLQERRMREVASRDNTTVMEYTYETPERQASPGLCASLARDVFCQRRKLSMLSAEAASELITSGSEALSTFSRTHPRIFEMMMDLDKGPPALEMLEKMARIRIEAEQTGMSETECLVHVNRKIMESTVRDATPEDIRKASVS